MKILILIILIMMININIVLACTCIEENFIQAYNRASTIFEGKVDEIKINKDVNGLAEIKLSVNEYWKKETKKDIIIYSSQQEATCGYNFEKGKEYIVYAETLNKKLIVSLCGRTNELENAEDDLYILEDGTKPTTEAVTTELKAEWFVGGVVITVLILMYLVLSINQTKLR